MGSILNIRAFFYHEHYMDVSNVVILDEIKHIMVVGPITVHCIFKSLLFSSGG